MSVCINFLFSKYISNRLSRLRVTWLDLGQEILGVAAISVKFYIVYIENKPRYANRWRYALHSSTFTVFVWVFDANKYLEKINSEQLLNSKINVLGKKECLPNTERI